MQERIRLTHEIDNIGCGAPNDQWHAAIEFECTRTICGEALDADGSQAYITKTVNRGGITCPICLRIIKQIKSIKL